MGRGWRKKVNVADLWKSFEEAGYPHSGPEFREHRDAVVNRFVASSWYQGNVVLQELVEEWEETDDLDYFNFVLSAVYDLADEERVWIETVR